MKRVKYIPHLSVRANCITLTKKQEEGLKALVDFLNKHDAKPCLPEHLPERLTLIGGGMTTKPIVNKNGREIKIKDGRLLENIPKREIN